MNTDLAATKLQKRTPAFEHAATKLWRSAAVFERPAAVRPTGSAPFESASCAGSPWASASAGPARSRKLPRSGTVRDSSLETARESHYEH